GLLRAGVGRIETASGDLTEINRAIDETAGILLCTDSDTTVLENNIRHRLTNGIPVIPLVLENLLVLAGPILRDPEELTTWSAFVKRALSWARAEQLEPGVRPVADALGGAFAGRLLFDAL